MSLIALLTDFGLKDNYVGVMKGVMLSINPKLEFVDITHEVASHQIRQASFLLLKSYSYFPKGTIFLAVVDPGVGSWRKAIAIKTKNYFFVGPDNGVLSLACRQDSIKEIVLLENKKYFLKQIYSTPLEKIADFNPVRSLALRDAISNGIKERGSLTGFTFHGRDIFAPAAAYLSKGVSLSSFGRSISKIEKIKLSLPRIKNNSLEGEVIYADRFGNLVTNFKKEELDKFLEDKRLNAFLNKKPIKKICSFYAEAKDKEPFFIEGSFGYLEISLKDKSAKEYFGIKDIEKVKVMVRR